MHGLLDSLKPLWDKYKIEVSLIFIALIIALISSFIFIANQSSAKEEIPILNPVKPTILSENKIVVDLSGAVENPNVYEVSSGARLKDVLILAGGLSVLADRQFFARNFNLARILKDQEKFYIPNSEETQTNEVQANLQSLPISESNTLGVSDKININTASIDQLDTLIGVGKITAQKIIQNRHYQSIDDLLNKKIVGKSVFEKIRELISI